MALVDTSSGGFIEGSPRGWRKIESAPKDGAVVDVWLKICATPMSFGVADSFGVPDAWYSDGKWLHQYRGSPTELNSQYITHWRKKRAHA